MANPKLQQMRDDLLRAKQGEGVDGSRPGGPPPAAVTPTPDLAELLADPPPAAAVADLAVEEPVEAAPERLAQPLTSTGASIEPAPARAVVVADERETPAEPDSQARPTQRTTRPSSRRDSSAPRSQPKQKATPGDLPPLVFRRGKATERRSLHVPAVLAELQQRARDQGIMVPDLVLSAVAAHGDSLREEARQRRFVRRPGPTLKWTLLLSEEELADIDALVDDVGPAFGSAASRAVVVSEALLRCMPLQ